MSNLLLIISKSYIIELIGKLLEGCKLYSNISRVQSCNMCIVRLKACARNKLFMFKINKSFNNCMYFEYDSSFFPRIW